MSEFGKIVGQIAEDFYRDRFDVSARDCDPCAVGWSSMPYVECVDYLRDADTPDRTILVYITSLVAIDRARDSVRLWWNGLELLENHPEVFDPLSLLNISSDELSQLLNDFNVSQNNQQDPQAWLDIARTVVLDSSCPVSRVIYGKTVDAKKLLKDLTTRAADGSNRFPLLSGKKTAAKWIRLLASPGGASVTHIDSLPVTVDSHVSRATENLGLVKKDTLNPQADEKYIQSVWRSAVATVGFDAPDPIKNTCAGLDPALSVFGRYGCTHCERTGTPVRFGLACNSCRLLR